MVRKANKRRPDVAQSTPAVQGNPPASLLKLINGNTIDISAASDFYKRKAEVATLLRDFVERAPRFRYVLKNNFDRYFSVNLSIFIRNPYLKPADALADALFSAGKQWASIDYGRLPLASIPTDDFLRDQWTGAAHWDSFLIRDSCVGEIWWHNLGPDGKVHRWKGGSAHGDFELRVDFGTETTKPPTMTIGVKGEPAAKLMKWWTTLTPNSPAQKQSGIDLLRRQTVAVVDSLLGTLKTNLKLLRAERGRPRVDFGERAAHLLDHQKMPIVMIAKELCHMPADANQLERRQCFDRIRKAAQNYYKLLRSDYTEPTDVRVRTRIISIPGNPNAGKAE